LIAGNRRYTALKELKKDKILAVKFDKEYKEIQNKIDVLQFEENEQRKSLDNFEISDLFQKYIERGFSQAEICKLFNKRKQYVYSLLKLQKLDQEIKSFLLEFQIYAWSKEKFEQQKELLLKENKDIEDDSFYIKNKGFIGWNILYKISNQAIPNQRKMFFNSFKDRLTEKEIKTYFSDLDNKERILNSFEDKLKKTIKEIEKFEKILFDMPEELEQEKKDKILKAIELLQDASKILS